MAGVARDSQRAAAGATGGGAVSVTDFDSGRGAVGALTGGVAAARCR